MRKLLSGETVSITAIKDSDLTKIEDWFNQVDFMRFYDMVPGIPKTEKDVKQLIEAYASSNESYLFAIREKSLNKIIGIIGFDEIIWSNGVATVFLGIGDTAYKGKGLGTEALKLVLEFGFYELNFHRIQLCVISYNEAAIRLYEKAGFIKEGTYRDFIFRDGKRFDMYLYGLLKEEWEK